MSQPRFRLHVIVTVAVLLLACMIAVNRSARAGADNNTRHNPVVENATQKVLQGEQIFRFDTFGDEAFWGDTLKLHQAIEGASVTRLHDFWSERPDRVVVQGTGIFGDIWIIFSFNSLSTIVRATAPPAVPGKLFEFECGLRYSICCVVRINN